MKTRNIIATIVLILSLVVFSQNDGPFKIDSLKKRVSNTLKLDERFSVYTESYDVGIDNFVDAAKNYLDSLAVYTKKGKAIINSVEYFKRREYCFKELTKRI